MTIKTFMAIMAERDAAIRERNLAVEARKRAFADRDMAMLQRDAALTERNSAIQERDEAISSLRFVGNPMNTNNETPPDLTGAIRVHNDQETNHMLNTVTGGVVGCSETAKPKRVKREENIGLSTQPMNLPMLSTKEGENTVKWENEQDFGRDDVNLNRQHGEWTNNLGLNEVNFDELALPVPVCSCTGVPKPCYKWGNGGWQSACCTTTMSVYPLPQVSNKRYSRVGARKMSGTVFAKLLNRLVDEGYDLSTPLDLKDHWAKHGTNRYNTLK